MCFKKGDYVVKGNDGVCLIDDVVEKAESGITYYMMHSIRDESEKIFLPLENEDKIRPVLSEEDAIKLLNSARDLNDIEIPKERISADKYDKIIAKMDVETLLRTILTAKKRINSKSQKGKKSTVDEHFLSLAKSRLSDEIAISLNIEKREAIMKIDAI